MNRLVLFLAILFWTNNILCAEPAEVHVLARGPIIQLVRRSQLPCKCGIDANQEACTAFVGERLTCQCEQSHTSWRISARAQFIPVMYVLGVDFVSHERDHIKDIDESLRGYLTLLSTLQFDSADSCQRKVTTEVTRFHMTMDEFKEDSNVRRHPNYRRRLVPQTDSFRPGW